MPDSWKPERKIVAAAIAGLIVAVASIWVDVPAGAAVALPIVVGYLIPNRA